jgi:predicted DCC family thiol-disulfide oxidoreductase YuxK
MNYKREDGTFYIIFFDGYCGLCNGAVDFLIQKDKNKKFKYSPLQGEYIKKLNINIDKNNLDTLYVYDGEILLSKTKAWRCLAEELGGIWKFLAILSQILPLFILDFFYDVVAKNCYKIFNKRDVCRLPSPEEQSLFLD